MFGKSTLTYSYACQAQVIINAKSKLQSRNLEEFLKFGSICKSAKIRVQLCFNLQIASIVFCDKQFLERPSMWRVETSVEHIFVKYPQTKQKKLTAKMAFDIRWRLQYWTLLHLFYFTSTPRFKSLKRIKNGAKHC